MSRLERLVHEVHRRAPEYHRSRAGPRGEGCLYRLYFDQTLLGPYYERLARLYDEREDLENAARYYAMLVELWAGADEELQPRVRAAQERLEQIVAERG